MKAVYESNSIMAAAVAAHECGHAVQHARMYAPLKMRSALVPVVNFASSIMTWVLLGGILLINSFPAVIVGRYYPVCYDYTVQLYHAAGGNQCK